MVFTDKRGNNEYRKCHEYCCCASGLRPAGAGRCRGVQGRREDKELGRVERPQEAGAAEGAPLRQRRYCFSESFYAIANAEYYGLTGEKVYLDRAKQAYELYWGLFRGLIDDPVGMGPKTIPETRSGRSLGLAVLA